MAGGSTVCLLVDFHLYGNINTEYQHYHGALRSAIEMCTIIVEKGVYRVVEVLVMEMLR